MGAGLAEEVSAVVVVVELSVTAGVGAPDELSWLGVLVGAEGSKAEPEPISPGELVEPGCVHLVIVAGTGADVLSGRY